MTRVCFKGRINVSPYREKATFSFRLLFIIAIFFYNGYIDGRFNLRRTVCWRKNNRNCKRQKGNGYLGSRWVDSFSKTLGFSPHRNNASDEIISMLSHFFRNKKWLSALFSDNRYLVKSILFNFLSPANNFLAH